MNIGIITTWFDRGAAFVSKAYLDTLSQQHKVFIYARGGEQFAIGDERWDLDYVTWGSEVPGKPYCYIDWVEFRKWIKKNNIDLLIFNEQQDWDIILRLQKLNIPIGAYIDYYTHETASFYGLYDFLLCNTKRHYEVFKNHPQAVYIPWGTDLTLFFPTNPLSDKETITFFHSCGVSPDRKGTDLLVKAFIDVTGNAKLIIHSQWPLEKPFPELFKLINNDERISLIEKVVPPPGLFHLGDVYVYPSILEGIGLTIAEALASGLPVITTNEPPMNEFIVDGINGKLVQVESYKTRSDGYYWPQSYCEINSLVQAMQFFIINCGDISIFKANAHKFAVDKLDWQKNSSILCSLVNEIRIIHKSTNKDLIRSVKNYEIKRIRYESTPPLPFSGKVKRLLKNTIVFPLVVFIWNVVKNKKSN